MTRPGPSLSTEPAARAAGSRPAALTRDWLPRTDVAWLEELRMWHRGQVGAWERAKRVLRDARAGDFEGYAEDERLAAAELARIVAEVVRLVDGRRGDPVVEQLDVTASTVLRARGWLRLDAPAEVAPVHGEGAVAASPGRAGVTARETRRRIAVVARRRDGLSVSQRA